MIFLFIMYIGGFLLAILKNKKVNKLVFINFIVTGLFFFGVIIIKFLLINFRGDINTLLFLDENTYVNGQYDLGFFGVYARSIVGIFGVVMVKGINIFVYIFSTTALFNRVKYSLIGGKEFIKFSMLILISALFSYWSFFVLKESLTIFAITLIIVGIEDKKKISTILGFNILFITRLNYFCLFIYALFLYKLNKKNKKFFYLVITISILGLVIFLSSSYSYSFKLGIIARRLGDSGMVYTGNNAVIANFNFVRFIFSAEYLKAIEGNILRGFIGGESSMVNNIFSLILTISNLVAIITTTELIKEKSIFRLFYILSILVLILTYCDNRYLNTVLLPFSLYSFANQINIRRVILKNENKYNYNM